MGCCAIRKTPVKIQNTKNQNQIKKGDSDIPPPSTHKLTEAEVNEKRQAMKKNLQEGNFRPPVVKSPTIGVVTGID